MPDYVKRGNNNNVLRSSAGSDESRRQVRRVEVGVGESMNVVGVGESMNVEGCDRRETEKGGWK